MERDRRGNRQLSPTQWKWTWRVSMVTIGPACILTGLLGDPVDARLIFLGVVTEIVGVMMLGFWNQVQANRDADAEKVVHHTPDSD